MQRLHRLLHGDRLAIGMNSVANQLVRLQAFQAASTALKIAAGSTHLDSHIPSSPSPTDT